MPSMPRSSSCSTRRCAASRSPSAAASCWPLPTKPRPSGFAAACRGGGRASSVRSSSLSAAISSDYQRLGDAAIEVLGDFTPLVERISIDEAFADVAGCTHLFGSPAEIAGAIRRRVRAELGLPISVGVARTKHLAKIASQVAKPDGLVVVDPGTRAGLPARPARRADVGRGPGHQGAAGRDRRADDRAAGEDAGTVARAAARSRGRREARGAGVESRSAAKSGPHRRARSAGAQSALGRKPAEERVFRPDPASSRRPDRHAGCAPSRGPAAP